MDQLKKLAFLLSARQKRRVVALAALLLITMLMEMLGLGLVLPALSVMLTDDIGAKYPALEPYLTALGNPTQAQLVVGCMSALVLFYVLKTLFLIYATWRQARFSVDLSAELSAQLFVGYLRQPYTFHLQRNSAHLIQYIHSETRSLTNVSQAYMQLGTECAVVIGIALMLCLAEPLGAVTIAVFLGLSALGFHRMTRRRLLTWGDQRVEHARLLSQHTLQGLEGVKDVKLAGKELYFLSRYDKHNLRLATLATWTRTLQAAPRLYLELIAVIGLAALVLTMLWQSSSLELLLPTLGIFVVAAFRMLPSANRIMGSFQTLRSGQATVEVLYKEFRSIPKHTGDEGAATKIPEFSNIQVDGLRYRYPSADSDALDGVSLTIKRGQSVGFVGRSGSGKSTLIDVILGLLPPSDGDVTLDSRSIRGNLRGWQGQIGYVPQTIYLTDDTVRRNIAFGLPDDEIDEHAITHAVKAAQLDEFLSTLPDGVESIVGQRGIRLSGGQRQRIGIARALYHDPAVLVLDEATSALDNETEASVMEAITALHGTKTILIVAHRLSTISQCDHIFRLESGQVLSDDTNAELSADAVETAKISAPSDSVQS